MTPRVVWGTIFVVATMIILAIYGINEPARMKEFEVGFQARSIGNGAWLFENNCRSCHGPQGLGVEGVAPALNTYKLFNGERLAEVGFAGTARDFVKATISSGRPVPSAGASYPNRMPTWSARFGGPMRDDQIEDLTNFVMNWAPGAGAPTAGGTPAVQGVGADIDTPELPAGDATRGEALAKEKGCVGCHVDAAVGPAWLASADASGQGIGARAETRYTSDGYTGQATSAAQYLRESIVQTNAYVVPGFTPDVMPKIYGDTLSAQDLADIMAYLQTLK